MVGIIELTGCVKKSVRHVIFHCYYAQDQGKWMGFAAAAAAFLNYKIPTGAGRFQMPGCVAIVAGQGIEWDSCSCSKSLGRTLVAA